MTSRARLQASRVFDVLGKARHDVTTKIADQAARLVGITDRLKTSDQQWSALGEYVTQHVACVLAMRPSTSMEGDTLKEPWKKLQTCVQRIKDACSARLECDTAIKVAFSDADERQIVVLRQEFDQALGLFKLNLDLKNFTEAEKFLSSLNVHHLTRSIVTEVKEDVVSQAIHELPYAVGASWDPTKACLPGTRVDMLDKMWNFIHAMDGATCAQIFWLVDVAGSGKTAIAHSLCKKAKEAGLLVTSFFFDRMSAERNNPDKVITTMARDLAIRDKRIAIAMSSALEQDASLRSASITRQFDELIAQPSLKTLTERQQPHVVFLDGLDEGITPDEQLTVILANDIRVLPGNFRILVTSRPLVEISYAFGNVDHIQKHTINLRSATNQGDIGTYMRHRLIEVASKRRRKLPWPEPSRALELLQKSEGHFLWASAVTDFLGRATNPDRQLDDLLSLNGAPNTEAKMDQLYAAVLQMCPWQEDVDFVHGYAMYMGTVLAAKEPLTANAMQKLHGSTVHPRDIFEKLGSLITGFEVGDEAVRLLHLSLQEYLALRAPSPYHLVERQHSQTLAMLCLRVLNLELASDIPSLDTFSLDDPTGTKIPEISTGMISETLHYASLFWTEHVSDVTSLSNEAKQSLQRLLSTQLIRWIKLCVCMGRYPSLGILRDWLHTIAPDDDMLVGYVQACHLTSTLTDLACRLRFTGRREEALLAAEDAVITARCGLITQEAATRVQEGSLQEIGLAQEERIRPLSCVLYPPVRSSLNRNRNYKPLAKALTVLSTCLGEMGLRQKGLAAIEESVDLYRYLAKNQVMDIIPDLAVSLNIQSNRQSRMGHREEALKSIEEAVQIWRVLVQKDAAGFTPVLAESFVSLSHCLGDLGLRQEALKAIEEAIPLQRVLVQGHSAAFTHALARSLNSRSLWLGELGRREEALKEIEEAVQLRRVLVQAHAAAFTPYLASVLNSLSLCLGELGQHEEALNAIEEAVQLRRELFQANAVAFTTDLAESLNNLSIRLGRLGRGEEQLKAITEAVQLQRELVQENSAAFNPGLAQSLNNLSICLAEMGRLEEAIKVIKEAVEIRRVQVLHQPAAFTPLLASTLNNLSIFMRELGRYEESLKEIQQAVQLRRVLVQDHAVAFTPALAQSLSNLSSSLSNLGRREEALKVIEEAVQLHRVLVQEHTRSSTGLLAECLILLSDRLGDAGRDDEALKVIDESVQLHRVLVQEQAAAFNPVLAQALNSLSNRLGALGRGEEGIKASEEAILLHRMLVQDQAARFNPELASSLFHQSSRWSEIDQHQEALSSAQEAHDLYSGLAAEHPAAFNRKLKNSFKRLSQVYADLGREEESALAAREAEDVQLTVQ